MMAERTRQPVLELRSITKEFPGTRALDDVSLKVHAGEVVALLGENGAGKSTLMKILSGVWAKGSFRGEIFLDGRSVEFHDTRDALNSGIAMIHQELSVFPELTVAEHLELDRLSGWINWEELFERSQRFLDSIGFRLHADSRVGDLSIGAQQLVEIARALDRDAKVIVFDEPTSALTDSEVLTLYRIIDRLREEGRAIIYITHRMDEVFRLADRMVVLRDGKFAGELDAYGAVGKDSRLEQGGGDASSKGWQKRPRSELEPRIISMMVGREIEDIYPSKNTRIGDEVLAVRNLTLRKFGKTLVNDLTFTLKKGEILGLAGLLGAGRSEALETLFGVLSHHGPRSAGVEISGEIRVHGEKFDPASPADAISSRIAFVSEDRKGSGLILDQSIRQNMSLPSLASNRSPIAQGEGFFSLLSPINEEQELELTRHWAGELKLKAAHLDQPVGELSGGNQQKVVLAKWLLTGPSVLFLDEPTRGIDIGAKLEIYQWIQKLAAEGMGIILASSEMPEVIGLSHRILVLREGHLSRELNEGQATQAEIMRAASL